MKQPITLFITLLLAPLAALHAADAPNQEPNNALMLDGDWLPEDPHQIDYEKLPRVTAKHAVISDVRDHAGTRVHQHAYLAHHDGRFWAMWSDGPGGPRAGVTPEQHRNIVPAHDLPDTRNSFATSKDGLHWTTPADLTGPPRIKGYRLDRPRSVETRRRTPRSRQPFQRAGIRRSWTEPGSLSLERHEMGGPRHGP